MINVLTIFCAYLIGSIPIGVILARLKGKDPRKTGSGNIGATNVMRSAGKVVGIITLIGDIMKGFIPTLVAIRLEEPGLFVASVGLAAFLGHLFPIFLKFRGGKGVATGTGIFLAINPLAILICFVIFAIVFFIWKYVSLGSLAGTAVIPFSLAFTKTPQTYILLSIVVACGIFIKHRGNIKRLIAGTENRVKL